ncbi:MAG: NYN domain-containing protein [Candidatus Aminicenantales bacterium]
MAYLIDGNNFIGYLSPSFLKDPRSKQALISQLLVFNRQKRTKIYLVFDGPPLQDLETKKLREESLSIIYPGIDEDADRVIKRIIEKQTDLRRFSVVSSDREIRRFAKTKGARSLSCKDFHRLLKASLREYRKDLETKKKDIALSPLEVDHWIDIFGPKK